MANFNNPNGFRPISFPARTNVYKCSATVTKGDALAIASGEVLPFASASHTAVIGVAAESGAATDSIQVYDDLTTEFEAQTSGTFALSQIGGSYDIEGATGVMQVNEDDASPGICVILAHYPLPGSEDVGNNARVKVVLGGHATVA